MSNLLEKASIILTPTAYKNSRVMCVKPSDASGDFTFSRNSAATRVNAQGLVENVQILSSNLVQNPSFSEEGVQEVSNGSFSQEGSELVTNGDFSNGSTDWNLTRGNVINDKLVFNTTGQPSGSRSVFAIQNNVADLNKIYKVEFTISDYVSGQFRLRKPFITSDTFGNGTYTYYGTASEINFELQGRLDIEHNFSIDNVSVREVAQNWTLGTGWSIAEDKAISDGSVAANSYLISTGNTLTIGKTYKVQYTVLDYIQGNVRVRAGQASSIFVSADGTYTEYMVATSTESVRVQANSNFIGSITNISVKEVGQNWELETGFSIGENKAVATNASNSNLQQTNITITNTKKYKINFKIDDYSSGTIKPQLGAVGAVVGTAVGANGTYTEILTANNNFDRIVFRTSGSAFNGSVTNISVIEITDDTNLPRINYEGFSYDGSGAIIPDSGCGSWLFEPQSTNLFNNSEDFSSGSWVKTDCSVVSNFGVSPSGQTNASKLTFTTTNDQARAQYNLGSLTTGNTYTQSYYIKSLGTDITLRIGTSASAAGEFVDIIATSEWQRFEFTGIASGTTEYPRVQNITGALGVEILVWGAQFEALSYATSYIPTSGSTVTRNQDVCTNGGSLASINSTSGTLYGEFSSIASDNNSNWINISDGTATNWLFVGRDFNKVRIYLRANNAVVVSDTTTPLANNNKVALSYKSGDIRAYINGVEIVNLTSAFSFTSALNTLDFNAYNGGGTTTQIAWKAVAVWKEALTDAELTELTTI